MSNPNYSQQKNNNDGVFLSSYDNTLIFIVLFLIIVGFLAIFSAGAPKCIIQGTHSTFFVARQFVWFILGCIGMFTISQFNYKALNKLSLPIAWIIIGLLIGVHFFGTTVNGAQRWLTLGPIQFQPSEAAKLSVILLLASAFSKDINLFNTKLYKYYIPILIMVGLIFKQPNLSMVLILLASSMFMYFAAGGSIKLIMSAIGMGIFGLSFVFHSYQKQRID